MAQSVPRIIKLKYFFEKYGFHVSSRLADSLGMRGDKCKTFFYLHIFCYGRTLVWSIFNLAFWIKLKDLIRAKELQYLTCNSNSIYCNNATFYRSLNRDKGMIKVF
jgi:hypothetical protein